MNKDYPHPETDPDDLAIINAIKTLNHVQKLNILNQIELLKEKPANRVINSSSNLDSGNHSEV